MGMDVRDHSIHSLNPVCKVVWGWAGLDGIHYEVTRVVQARKLGIAYRQKWLIDTHRRSQSAQLRASIMTPVLDRDTTLRAWCHANKSDTATNQISQWEEHH